MDLCSQAVCTGFYYTFGFSLFPDPWAAQPLAHIFTLFTLGKIPFRYTRYGTDGARAEKIVLFGLKLCPYLYCLYDYLYGTCTVLYLYLYHFV